MTKKQVYLAGGIDKRKDRGTTWRRLITPHLERLGYNVFNPCLNESPIYDKHEVRAEDLEPAKYVHNRDVLDAFWSEIVDKDLEAIADSSLMIVLYDDSVNDSGGTLGEMVLARFLKIPVLCIRYIAYERIPNFQKGCVYEYLDNIDECVKYIRKEFK